MLLRAGVDWSAECKCQDNSAPTHVQIIHKLAFLVSRSEAGQWIGQGTPALAATGILLFVTKAGWGRDHGESSAIRSDRHIGEALKRGITRDLQKSERVRRTQMEALQIAAREFEPILATQRHLNKSSGLHLSALARFTGH